MAMQQINLYQAEFRKEKKPLTADMLLQVIAVLAVVLLAFYAFSYWQLLQSRQQLSQLQQQKKQATQRLAELRKIHKPLAKNPRLANDIKRYQQWANVRQQAINVLSEKKFGNTEGFANHFVGLARQRLQGVWLTELSFSSGGSNIGMQGSALQPELVPRFLQRLSAEEIFTGTRFRSFVMNREKETKQQIDFSLQGVDEGDAS
jgi:Tfp pilus assembly protein PilN